jgi:hypothetical protein
MAEIAAMDIVIGANVQGAIQGLEHLSTELAQLAKGGVTSINQLDKAMETLRPAIKNSTSTAEITKLNIALKGLEDEAKPIKSIGIAPALGGAGTAAKKAGTDFTNLSRVIQDLPFGFQGIQNNITQLLPAAGGLGLAVSAVTAAITFATVGFGAWTRGMGKSEEQLNELTAAMAANVAGAQTEITKIYALVQVASDVGESSQTRTNAIKELQKEYPGYLANLSLETLHTKETEKAMNLLTGALLRKAEAAALSNLISKKTEELFNAQNQAIGTNIEFLDGALAVLKSFGGAGSGVNVITGGLEDQAEVVTGLEEQLKKLRTQFGLVIAEQAKGGDFAGLKPEKIKAVKVEVDKTKEAFDRLIATEIQFIDFLTNLEKVPLGIGDNFKKMFLDIKAGQDKLTASKAILPESMFEDLDKKRDERKKKEAEDLANIMKAAGALENVFSGIFTNLAQTGQLSIQSLIKSIEQLIIKLASAAAAAALISAFLPGGQVKTLGGFAGIFKGLLGFQHGGIITGPTMALMGEKGPEVVLPLDRLREFMTGGSSQVVVLETRVRGDDLYLINSRTAARRGRAY